MDQTQFHFDPLERVMEPAKRIPVNAVSVGSVWAIQIKSVRIGAMAGSVPPSSFVQSGTGTSICILIFVSSAEASSHRRHGRTCGSKDKATIKIYRAVSMKFQVLTHGIWFLCEQTQTVQKRLWVSLLQSILVPKFGLIFVTIWNLYRLIHLENNAKTSDNLVKYLLILVSYASHFSGILFWCSSFLLYLLPLQLLNPSHST